VRCSRCGNENPGLNRFCGMCGATLLAPAAPSASVSSPGKPVESANSYPRVAGATATPNATVVPQQRPPEPVATRTVEPDPQPIISGPSFLGLNQPGPARSAGAGRGSQSESSSRSLDYLLEDEEAEPQGRGKFILVMIALALALGLGYLRWRNEGLDWLTSGIKKTLGTTSGESASQPAANGNADNSTPANPSSASSETLANSPPAAAANGTAASSSAPPDAKPGTPTSGGAPANPATANPAPGGREVVPVDSDSGAKAPADAGANSSAAKGAPPNPAANRDSTDSSDDGSHAAVPAASAKRAASKPNDEDAENSDDEDSAPAAKPAPALTKPHAAKPLDVVAEGEKYIYGRGVVQDCDRGVKTIRQAANQSNAKAMISLGALYSAGLCTPRDLPTAYRWFAIALRKEPDNNSVQTDLQKLWSEMTPPERQLAIKLSQ
jgi:hypothetical protein